MTDTDVKWMRTAIDKMIRDYEDAVILVKRESLRDKVIASLTEMKEASSAFEALIATIPNK